MDRQFNHYLDRGCKNEVVGEECRKHTYLAFFLSYSIYRSHIQLWLSPPLLCSLLRQRIIFEMFDEMDHEFNKLG